jgi:hypothetical protein
MTMWKNAEEAPDDERLVLVLVQPAHAAPTARAWAIARWRRGTWLIAEPPSDRPLPAAVIVRAWCELPRLPAKFDGEIVSSS